jgi:hypothetical protein
MFAVLVVVLRLPGVVAATGSLLLSRKKASVSSPSGTRPVWTKSRCGNAEQVRQRQRRYEGQELLVVVGLPQRRWSSESSQCVTCSNEKDHDENDPDNHVQNVGADAEQSEYGDNDGERCSGGPYPQRRPTQRPEIPHAGKATAAPKRGEVARSGSSLEPAHSFHRVCFRRPSLIPLDERIPVALRRPESRALAVHEQSR